MSSKVRAVLVGCGGITNAWLGTDAVTQGVEIVGLVDINREKAESCAEKWALSAAKIGTDLPAMLDDVNPEVVFDLTIPAAHTNVTITALRHGCHVLGEKPLADSMEHAQQMLAAAEESGKIYAVIQNRRYDPNIRRLLAFLQSGAIGKITMVHSDFIFGKNFGATNFRTSMAHVLILDMAIHTFDAARFITGANPRSVYCQEWNPAGSWYQRDSAASAIFEMTDGIVYTYLGSWCARGMNTTWEASWRVIGERGSVLWDGAQGFQAQALNDEGKIVDIEVPEFFDPLKTGFHGGVIAEFLRCVRDGGTPETICTDNVHSIAMVHGAIASSEQEKKIRL